MKNQSTDNSTADVGKKLFAGLRWAGISQIFQQILNLGSTVVMARLLLPDDFGLLAMASVFTGIVFFVLDMGLGTAIVQCKDLKKEQISSVFWVNVFLGLIMTLMGIILSIPIAKFYQTPALQPIVMLLSVNFLLFSLRGVQTALLKRQMNFRSLEIRTLIATFLGVACGIVMAFMGFGIWSLVTRILVIGLVEVIFLWAVSEWRPSLWFRWGDVQEFIGFGNNVLLGNLLIYAGRNADNLIIGRFLGATPLGYYALAYNLMMLPVKNFSKMLAQVLFPALSRLQDELEKVKQSWLRATRMTAALIVPLMLGLILVASQFVETIYGEKWLPAVPVLRVLAFSGIIQSLSWLNSTVLLSLGKVRLRLKLTFFSVVLAICSFVIGLQFGLLGVATCFVVASTISETFFLYNTIKCVGSTFLEYFQTLFGVLAASIGMGIVILFLITSLQISPNLLLLITILVGSIVYLMLLGLFARKIFKEALNFLPARSKKSSKKPI